MSGIEVAGIALAVFPIVVNGVSGFAKGARTIKYWRRCRAQLEDYASKIKGQRVYYLDTLEGLLNDIVASEDDLERLLSDPKSSAWQSPVYDQRLRGRLDRSYDVYLEILKTMVDALHVLSDKLGISSADKVLWDDQSFVEREMKRLKVALLKDVYKELFETIDESNRKLRDITHQSIYLEQSRKKRRTKYSANDLRMARKHVASLHRVLISDKTWRCACRKSHMASLRLERSRAVQEKDIDGTHPHRFRVLISTNHRAPVNPTMSQWQELEIQPSIDNDLEDTKILHTNVSGRRVRFATTILKKATMIVNSHHKSQAAQSVMSISDMCSAIYKAPRSDNAIGFLIDENNRQHKHHLSRADTPMFGSPRSRTLAERLASPDNDLPSGSLSRKDRLEIAVTLASSVLQLDGTSWLQESWDSSDIFFHEKNNSQPTATSAHPYLPWKPCFVEERPNDPPAAAIVGNQFIQSNILFALGLTLIELCFGRTLLSLRRARDENQFQDEKAKNINCAFRLLDSGWILGEMGETYESVVRRCLRQLFDFQRFDLDKEEVQQKVYDTVVAPLSDTLDNLLGTSRIR